MKKTCLVCKNELEGKSLSLKFYCSKKCKNENQKSKYSTQNEYVLNTARGTVGAISELKICADLLSKGYYVFRAVSPNCICDLAIIVNNKLLRIEVTTGFYTVTGKISHPKQKKENYKYDILAIYVKDGTIIYEPELPISNV